MNKFLGAMIICLCVLTSPLVIREVRATVLPPYFDDCSEEDNEGDISFGYGNYSVPGLSSSINGTNEVFRTVRSSYYQCLCTTGANSSVQANWWKVDGLDEQTITDYISQGWTQASGANWNMPAGNYLVKNFNYSCSNPPLISPTPTVAVTATPTPNFNNPDSSAGGVGGPGTGDPSAPVCNDAVLQSPILISVVKSGSDAVDLVWTNVSEATDYMISYGLDPNQYIYGVPHTGNTTTFRIAGLDISKHYYFQVRAIKGCMPGTASNELAYPQSATAIGGHVLGLAVTSGINIWVYVGTSIAAVGVMIWLWRRYVQAN